MNAVTYCAHWRGHQVRLCCSGAPSFFIEDVGPPNYVIYCPVCRHRVSGKDEAVVVEVWNHVEEF